MQNLDLLLDEPPNLSNEIVMNEKSFNNFLKNESLRTFKITTNKKEYKCNFYGIFSSKIIREILQKSQSINEYTYDFDDEFGEFQFICDIFNFEKVDITVNNMSSLKEIAEDLGIEIIQKKINNFIEKYEKNTAKIDTIQDDIDSIDELFDWLYHIKEKNVISVKNLIVDSIWCQTEENIQELAAFLLQVINTDILLHQYLVDLLIELDKEGDNLKILIPFIVKKLMISFGLNNMNCSFIYKLYKKGFISIEEINNHLINFFKNRIFSDNRRCFYRQYAPFTEANLSDSDSLSHLNPDFCFVYSWFLPEIIELNKFDERIFESSSKSFCYFIKSYYPNRIDEYKKMRESDEPDDEITKSLRNDDVDTLQSVVSLSQEKKSKSIVPYNLYESFVPNGETNFLNYAAAYGSLKCFKYLLLNYEKCDESTFGFAVYGGNIEIIKIVDQNTKKIDIVDDNLSVSSSEEEEELINGNKNNNHLLLNKIIPSITKHQNDLFDWIFEQNFMSKNINKKLLNKIVIDCVQNGNAHSFIEMIDKGFDLSSDESFQNVFKVACENGFYRLSEIIFQIYNNKTDVYYFDNIIPSVSFGNISIFKYYLKMKKSHRDLEKAFVYAVLKDHRNIIKYFFDKLVKDGFQINEKWIFKSLNISVIENSSDLFFYLVDQFKQTNPFFNENNFSFIEILSNACTFGNSEVVKAITDSIINDPKNDDLKQCFTTNFIKAAASESIEICQYFLDKKVPIDFNIISLKGSELSSLNEKVFSSLIENCNPSEKAHLLRFCFGPAIEKKNYELVEFLLKQNASIPDALIKACEKDDLKMVDLILKYKREPSFINTTSRNGTALCIAVKHNEIKIVKSLLSIPGINPGLSDHNNLTPLILAIPKVEMMNLILDFYGEKIIFQTEQIISLLKQMINLLFSKDSNVISAFYRILEIKNLPLNDLINNDNFLTFSCKTNNVDIAKIILNIDEIDVNISIPKSGDTPLMIAIKNKSKEVAELLIEDKRTNINASNYDDQNALIIAISTQQEQILDLLLNDEKFDPIESRLDYVFLESNLQTQIKILSSKAFDVNHALISREYQNKLNDDDDSDYSYYSSDSYYSDDVDDRAKSNNKNDVEIKSLDTVLQFAVRKNISEIIDFVIQHPNFDKGKSCLDKAICIAISKNNLEIFKKLINLMDVEMNNYDFLSVAIQNKRIEITTEILNNPHFCSKSNKMFNNFCRNLFSIVSNTFEIMEILYNYDKEHDNLIDLNKLSSFGETVFTSINLQKNDEMTNVDQIVNFLLDKGSDPNIPNQKGKYPLQHAIELNSIEFVLPLINSNKIDFTKRMNGIKNKTYLHLAAESKNPLILKEFLDRNLIDVNSTDELGETPLMDACRFNQKKNVKLLFKNDKLDYLHCNNKGEDALKIVQDPWNKNTGFVNDKKSYSQILMIQLKNKNGPPFDKDSDSNKITLESSSFMKSQKESNSNNNNGNFLKEEEYDKDDISNCYKSLNKKEKLTESETDYSSIESNISAIEKNGNNENSLNLSYSKNNSLTIAPEAASTTDIASTSSTKSFSSSSSRRRKNNSNKSQSSSSKHVKMGNKENIIHESSTNNADKSPNNQCNIENDQKLNSSSTKANKSISQSNSECLPPLKKKSNESSSQNYPKNEANENNKNESTRASDENRLKKHDFYFESLPPLKTNNKKENINNFNSSTILPTNEHNKNQQESTTNDSLSQQKLSSLNESDFNSKSSNLNDKKRVKFTPMSSDQNSTISPRSVMNKIRSLQKMAENGDSDAQFSLGVCYALGNGVPTDKEKAFKYYLMAAENGNKNAQYTAASCYSYGKGTEINKNKAFELYLKAAEQGFDKAQFAVGHFFEFGQGGAERNHEKAVEWYKKAAEQGHRAAIKVLEDREMS